MKHVGTVIPGLITFDTVQEAEDAIKKTYSDKEWVAQYGYRFELRALCYSVNPPQYYIHMNRVSQKLRRRNE